MIPKTVSLISDLVDQLLEQVPADFIVNFRASEPVIERMQYLLDQNREGSLTREERFELENNLQFEQLLGLMKVRALRKQERLKE